MNQHTPRTNGTSPPPSISPAEAAVSVTSSTNRRLYTLQAMEHAITSCASSLSAAAHECKGAREHTGDELKRKVYLAKRSVEEALESLHPIQSLVDVSPTQIVLTSTRTLDTIHAIEQIVRVCKRLTTADERSCLRAITPLATRCEEISKDLSTSFLDEIKTAQRELSRTTAPSASTLTA